uniref:Uncharacterized protein n=1 Tax=viral metagenome TaxID=1070528 RepID=A0A6C0LFM6_9ZZZZ
MHAIEFGQFVLKNLFKWRIPMLNVIIWYPLSLIYEIQFFIDENIKNNIKKM